MANQNLLNSTIFNKVIMAITGIIWVGYVIVHMLGNLQFFIGREMINNYAEFLHSIPELLWIARIVLIVSLILHIYTSLKLKFLNNSAKPIGYAKKSYKKSTIYSRTMIYTGLMILFFVIYHVLHFTMHVTDPSYSTMIEQYGPNNYFERHDVYNMVIAGFKEPLISIVYIVAVVFLGFHLSHAIQSMFQTLGINGPKITPKLVTLAKVIGFIVMIGFAAVPLSVLTGIVGGGA